MPGLSEDLRGVVLVPVPLHPRKLRERGYNQSRWIAEAVAGWVPQTRVVELLVRVRDTATQTRLDRRSRAENLKNAFAMAPGAGLYRPFNCVLVDDVFTTGSTLNACAEVLQAGGFTGIEVLTLGHG
jgi:ComF family protein